ncbi:MAG: hypothetical protein AAFQ98_16400 [Bacteroidota bacterium]
MLSLTFVCFALSIFLLYAAAQRVENQKGPLSQYFEARPLLSRIAASLLILVGVIVLSYRIGTTNALLGTLVIWPTLASLTLLLAPIIRVPILYMGLTAVAVVILEFLTL